MRSVKFLRVFQLESSTHRVARRHDYCRKFFQVKWCIHVCHTVFEQNVHSLINDSEVACYYFLVEDDHLVCENKRLVTRQEITSDIIQRHYWSPLLLFFFVVSLCFDPCTPLYIGLMLECLALGFIGKLVLEILWQLFELHDKFQKRLVNFVFTITNTQYIVIDCIIVKVKIFSINLGVIFFRLALSENFRLFCSLLFHDISEAQLMEEAC